MSGFRSSAGVRRSHVSSRVGVLEPISLILLERLPVLENSRLLSLILIFESVKPKIEINSIESPIPFT